jgi:hypothetical protein
VFVGRCHESDPLKEEKRECHVESIGEKCVCRVSVRKLDHERLLGEYSPEYARN